MDAAERYGWNAQPAIARRAAEHAAPGERDPTPLEVGSTAIGQGKVLATPLRAGLGGADRGGRRRAHGADAAAGRQPARRVRVTNRRVARTLERLMVDVVEYGTGTAAALPGVKVAGKTGTAELEDTRGPDGGASSRTTRPNTDAWFTAYAPARRPKIAVAVLLVRAGAGGATAAPAARGRAGRRRS